MKSLYQLLKLRFHWQWATLFLTRFPLHSSFVPTRFLAPMAASKIGPLRLHRLAESIPGLLTKKFANTVSGIYIVHVDEERGGGGVDCL
jgi:hypothetical protein